ncbi:MAG: HNH endonuclease [Candidatus Brocadiae bacterium]|nr:HNH endonuclease [Candidatus Brocadiia bacterium]
MPMKKELYPSNWHKISEKIKDRAGWTCQSCGKICRKPGEVFDTHKRTLTVSHIDHDPKNCKDENLQALCAPCHLRYDARHHAETRMGFPQNKDFFGKESTLSLQEQYEELAEAWALEHEKEESIT